MRDTGRNAFAGICPHRVLDPFPGCLPIANVVQQLVNMGIKPLLAFLDAPDFNTVLKRVFPGLRFRPKTGMPFKKSSETLCRTSLIFCWCSCLYRLGRREDETPFVVEWFAKNGIEVWSVKEGQQRFDTHVDKLLNYIRYWQASGESIKTSVRTKTRMEQLTKEGCFTGGVVPFGYRLEHKGRTNKRNQDVGDLVVDPDEAEIVKLIFQKYLYEGYGAQRLCRYLTEQGIKNKKGRNIPTTSINRIIKNPIYTGVIRNGDSQSDVLTDLQIIDEETFEKAQQLMEKRVTRHNDVPLNTKGRSLLVGNIYCGHCGGRLTLTTSGRKRVRKDGTVIRETRARYQCPTISGIPANVMGNPGMALKSWTSW